MLSYVLARLERGETTPEKGLAVSQHVKHALTRDPASTLRYLTKEVEKSDSTHIGSGDVFTEHWPQTCNCLWNHFYQLLTTALKLVCGQLTARMLGRLVRSPLVSCILLGSSVRHLWLYLTNVTQL